MIRVNQQFTTKAKKEYFRLIPKYTVKYLTNLRGQNPNEVYLFDNGKGKLAYSEPHSLSTAFRRHYQALGIKGVKSVHGFRAGFATMMRNEVGADLKTIQELLGLSDVRVLDHYFGNLDELPIQAIDKLDEIKGEDSG